MESTVFTYKVRLKGTEDWVEISEESYNLLSCEDGNRMPEIQGNKVIITNYLNMFWGRIMGARNFRVFMVLVQFAYGDKDYSYPSLQTLADICAMSVNTVKSAIRELEELGFVKQVQVYNNEKEESETNVYIVRKTTPFLSIEQYKSLPKKLQEEHRKYLARIEKSERILLTDAPDYPAPSKPDKPSKSDGGAAKSDGGGSKFDVPSSNGDYPVDNVDSGDNVDKYPQKGGSKFDVPLSESDGHQNLTEGGSKTDGGVGQNLTPNKYNTKQYNLNQLSSIPNIKELQLDLLRALKTKVSKPSFDMWLSTLEINGYDKSSHTLMVMAHNDFQRDWVQNKYTALLEETLASELGLAGMRVRVA